jgi:hypothetical protein
MNENESDLGLYVQFGGLFDNKNADARLLDIKLKEE